MVKSFKTEQKLRRGKVESKIMKTLFTATFFSTLTGFIKESKSFRVANIFKDIQVLPNPKSCQGYSGAK